jgi:hypothetical protein
MVFSSLLQNRWFSPEPVPCEHIRLIFAYTGPHEPVAIGPFMTFFYRVGWQVQFTQADGNTALPRTFTFADPENGSNQRKKRDRCGLANSPLVQWRSDSDSPRAAINRAQLAPGNLNLSRR